MDRSTSVFWALIAALLGASLFYGSQVWQMRAPQQQRDLALASGDLVQLVQVLDGDTLVVSRAGPGADPAHATVRLLGVKTFESKHAKDIGAPQGRAAEEAVRRLAGDAALRVLLNNPPRDRAGRTLATLYAGGDDIGAHLVAQGHALVYTVYPFPQMASYLQSQAAARAQRLGLWADPAVAERADALLREWARAQP